VKGGKGEKIKKTVKEFDKLPVIILTWVQSGGMGFREGRTGGKGIGRKEDEATGGARLMLPKIARG
jgi:hypothetical protein